MILPRLHTAVQAAAFYACVTLGLLSSQNAIAAPSLGEALVLSGRSTDNRHPVVACSQDGVHTFVAWEGLVGKERRILLREAVNGTWLPEIILDALPLGENELPALDVDAAGNPHVAWIALTDGRFVPHYAARIAGKWNSMSLPATEAAGDCDYVTIKLDDQGSPWIVWQSARGSAYEVHCAFLDGKGTFHVEALTPAAQTHNLFPEVVFDPEPTILWYAGREDGFYLVGERYVRSAGLWGDAKLAELDNLPGEPLPQLIRRPAGPLAAFWFEKPPGTENEADFDRVYFGEQAARLLGAGETLDQPLDASNSQISGAAAGDAIVAAWCSTSVIEGTQIYAAYGRSARESTSVKLSDGEELYYGNPRTASGGKDAVVVWESTQAEGGDGQIYMRQLQNIW